MKIRLYTTLLFAIFIAAIANSQSPRPNILLILMDDLGYADVGFMPNSEPDIYTPTIDALAEQGTVFTSAYVTHCFCGPSRTSLMTGRMPHSVGAQFNLAAFSGNGIDTKETFISTVLSDADYYTGVVGKWHLGEEGEYHPNNRGFDYFYGFLGGGHEYFSDKWLNHSTYNPSNYNTGNYGGDYNRPMMKNTDYVASDKGLYCTDVLTDAGVEFIGNAAADNEPFFLYMSYNAPHTPVQAMQADIDAIQAELGENAAEAGSDRLTYTAMMYNADYNIKRLVDELKSTDQYDNTLIVFLSDNGGKTSASAKNTPLKKGKGSIYEGGYRVPMFFHWPNGNVPQGYTNPDNFSSLDFYPTFAYLAGADIPEDKLFDGLNVWGDVINKTNPRIDSTIFALRPHNGKNQVGVRKNNYKLYTAGAGTWLLYDLSADIGETKNIAGQNPTIVSEMKQAAYEWTWSHIRPKFFDNPSYGFEDKWIETNMPNWELTFGEMFDSTDYNWDNWKEQAEEEEEEESSVGVYNSEAMYVYPNPVTTTVNVVFEAEAGTSVDAGIYDMQGRLVQLIIDIDQQSNAYTFEINPEVPNGIYILDIEAGMKSLTKRIVVSR